MADKLFENNQVTMIGEIVSEFEFSHEVYGEGFYLVDISVSRLSDSVDYIPLVVSERTGGCDTELYRRDHFGKRSVPLL